MDIVVTGSAGFIGKVVCRKLKSEGHNVVEIDTAYGQDVVNLNSLNNINRCDQIIHLAAKSYVPDSFINPYDFYKINIAGTLNVLETARTRDARVIFFSSYIYGNALELPVSENHGSNPHNPYAQSKQIGEELCCAYFRDFGVPTTIFRPFNIYGNGQSDNFLIPTILKQIRSGTVNLLDPNPRRDYIHVSDIADAVMCALDNNHMGCEVFNLGTGNSYSVEELVGIIKKYSKFDFTTQYSNQARQAEVDNCFADITKAFSLLGWKPKIKLEEGIKNLLKELDL